MARTPDVIVADRPAPSADSDAPMVPATQPPPLSASNDAADLAAGVPAERGPNNPPPAGTDAAGEQDAGNQAGDQAGDQPGDKGGEGAGKDTKPTDGELELDADGNPKFPEGTPQWAVREITKARNKEREARNLAKAADAQVAATRDELAKLSEQIADLNKRVTAPPEQPPAAFSTPRPARDAFDTPEAYEAALVKWGEDKAAFETEARLAKEAADAKAQADAEAREKTEREARERADAELADLNTKWTAKREAAIAEIPDYVAVAESDSLKISVPMAHAIFAAENGPQLAYHLGKNPAEAERIYSIPNTGLQIFEMGKLAATLAAAARPELSKAPPPIRPLTTQGNGAGDGQAQEESMDEYGARRTKEIQAARRPFIQTAH